MSKPVLPTLNDTPKPRDVSVAIKRLHGYMGDVEENIDAIRDQLQRFPAPLSLAQIIAGLKAAGFGTGLKSATAADLKLAPNPTVTPTPTPTPPPNHTDVVIEAKAELEGEGMTWVTDCDAFEITKRVAQKLLALGEEGVGLYAKTSGINCDGYKTDAIVYNNGQAFDIMRNAGPPLNENEPVWNDEGVWDPTGWRPPI